MYAQDKNLKMDGNQEATKNSATGEAPEALQGWASGDADQRS